MADRTPEAGEGTSLLGGEDGGGRRSGSRSKIRVVLVALATLAVVGIVSMVLVVPLTFRQGTPPDTIIADRLQQTNNYAAMARRILHEVPLVDGHNDLAWRIKRAFDGQFSLFDLESDMRQQLGDPHSCTDIPRIRQGMLGAQFWSAYTDCRSQYKDAVAHGLQAVDIIHRFVDTYSHVFQLATSADDISAAKREGKVASLIGLEGGHMIASRQDTLRMFYRLGVRYMTLTWNCNVPWADSNRPETDDVTLKHGGLTDWGKTLIVEMNRIGMMVDLSHVGAQTMRDALSVSRAPIIFSHSNARALCPHARNVPDDVIKKVKHNGGIIMVNFYNGFINCTTQNRYHGGEKRASIDQLIDHMEYIRRMIGVEHIGIGSDFDGSNQFPVELEDVSKYPNLIAGLLRRGWSEGDVKLVAGLNIMRVMRQVDQIRNEMRNMEPFDKPIDPVDVPVKSCLS